MEMNGPYRSESLAAAAVLESYKLPHRNQFVVKFELPWENAATVQEKDSLHAKTRTMKCC
jgi:hypothetical protein